MPVKKKFVSIRTKLVYVITLATASLLTVALLGVLSYDIVTFRKYLVDKTYTLAEVVIDNCTAALLFGDQQAASDTLSALQADPNIKSAIIVTKDNQVFAKYQKSKEIAAEPNWQKIQKVLQAPADQEKNTSHILAEFQEGFLDVYLPITIEQEHFGVLVLQSELQEIENRITRNITIFFVVIGLAFIVSLFVSARLQRVFANPILQLSSTMRRVSEEGNFDLRMNKQTNDEIGELIDGFNVMISQIQERDQKLEQLVNDLRNAKAVAESANKAKSLFLANMSHELRTPLNAIIGFCEIVIEDLEDAGQAQSVSDIAKVLTAGKHLLSLINEVLDFSKIEAGKLTLHIEDFDVKTLIEEVVNTVEPLIVKNDNQFVVNIDKDIDVMHADAIRVKQCLFNLLSNAAKFTKAGSIYLTATYQLEDNKVYIYFEVKDTGVGIASKNLQKLFNSFTQADEKVSHNYGGTGLGLAISKRICNSMGGDITVTSELGQGSIFTMVLPEIAQTSSMEK